ncbi:MAG: hypothetical protein AB7I30_00355 [Isosphaeraceae bacterium]
MRHTRRDALRAATGAVASVALGGAAVARSEAAVDPLVIGNGPNLFLDDHLIERLDGLERRVEPLDRLDRPVLESRKFGCTQPYVSVTRDAAKGSFRLWYNRGPAVWHAESDDGVTWANPRVAWDLPRSYGASLVDDGERASDPRRRFKLANWQATRAREDRPGDDGGMYVGFSPDGFQWTPHVGNPVLATWPEGYDQPTRHGVGDIVDVHHDPLSRRYVAAVKLHAVPEDGFAPGPRAGKGIRRLVGLSTSDDFVHWERPRRIFAPDDRDDGLLEFYGMGAVHLRGSLRIGLVRVLRDDLPCDPGGPRDGIGYSVLATSRDGVTWRRSREPFLDRDPLPGSWDHAMAWIGAAVPLGDETIFYYGGYARGHKVEPATERQIGQARMKRDRYLALVPIEDQGRLVTRPFLVPSGRLTINARAVKGSVVVRLLDAAGAPIADLGGADAKPVEGDTLAGDVRWRESLGRLRGRPARLEFQLRNAALFAFEFSD